MLKQHWTCFMKIPESTSRWCSVSIPSFTIHALIAWKSILREGIVLQTHINFPKFLPIFSDFLEWLSHLAPICILTLSSKTTKCSSPLTVQTLSPHGYHVCCSVPHVGLMLASPITHGAQPCTCSPHDSHMHTAYLTLPSWLASIPLHGCTDTPVILMYDSWRSHVG